MSRMVSVRIKRPQKTVQKKKPNKAKQIKKKKKKT